MYLTLSGYQRLRFGELLVRMKLVEEADIALALEYQRSSGTNERLGTILVRGGALTYIEFMRALGRQLTEVYPGR